VDLDIEWDAGGGDLAPAPILSLPMLGGNLTGDAVVRRGRGGS